jgi:hypothetical protein
MRHGLAIAWLVAVVVCVQAAPRQPRFEPPEPPERPAPISLAGTYWYGKCYADNFWLIFEEQGTINWGYGNLDAKKSGSTGTWRLDGNRIYFEFNKKTLEFEGTTDGTTLKGLTFNNSGSRFPTMLKLTPRP